MHTIEGSNDIYRGSAEAMLAELPPPARPYILIGLGPSVVNLGATPRLMDRFAALGALVEESWSRGGRIQHRGVRLAVTVLAWADTFRHGYGCAYPRTRGILRASLAPAFGALRIVPRRRWSLLTIAARLGLVRECAVKEETIRRDYVVVGDQAAADSVLAPDLGAALHALSRILRRVVIGRGGIELRWRAPYFNQDATLPPEALEIAVTVARASVERR